MKVYELIDKLLTLSEEQKQLDAVTLSDGSFICDVTNVEVKRLPGHLSRKEPVVFLDNNG